MGLRVMHLVMNFRMDLMLWGGDVRCGDLVKWFMMRDDMTGLHLLVIIARRAVAWQRRVIGGSAIT